MNKRCRNRFKTGTLHLTRKVLNKQMKVTNIKKTGCLTKGLTQDDDRNTKLKEMKETYMFMATSKTYRGAVAEVIRQTHDRDQII